MGTAMEEECGPMIMTAPFVAAQIAELAAVSCGDVFYDLGCGDGLLMMDVVRRTGCSAVGIELRPDLAMVAMQNCQASTAPVMEGSREPEMDGSKEPLATVIEGS